MGRPAPIPRRSSHLGSAACHGRSDYGSHSSTSAASSRSKRRQGNHNQFQTLKMFPDGHSGLAPPPWSTRARLDIGPPLTEGRTRKENCAKNRKSFFIGSLL